jgi:hypothetical protein
MNLIFNKLTFLLLSSTLMNSGIQFFINKIFINFLFGKTRIPIFVVCALILFIIYFLYALLLSVNTSSNKCGKSYRRVYLMEGLKTGLTMSLSYVLLIFVPFLKQPFIDIGGDNETVSIISEIFYMNFINIIMSIENYYNSQFEGCKLSDTDMINEIKKIEKSLNRPKQRRKRQVTVEP